MNLETFESMTNEQRKKLLSDLTESTGWNLLKFWIEYEDIDAMEGNLLDGEDGQSIEDIKLTRANLKFAKMMLNRPYDLIEDLTYEMEQSELPELTRE